MSIINDKVDEKVVYRKTDTRTLQARVPARMRKFLNELAEQCYPSREEMLHTAIREFIRIHGSTSQETPPAIWQARIASTETGWVQFPILGPEDLAEQVRLEARAMNTSVSSFLITALKWWVWLPQHAACFIVDVKKE